jgi:tetratricopeptide (TPR) repeat protein
VLVSGSRAGILVFVLTQLLLLGWIGWTMRKQRDAAKVRGRLLTLGGTVLGALVLGMFTFGERLYARFTDTASVKLKVLEWPYALELAKDYWRFGVGRGDFVLAFSKYYAEHTGKTFTHPENIVLQWVGELGVPLGLGMLALGVFLGSRLIWSRRNSVLEFAPLVGAAAVCIHNLADFSLEYPGVTVPLCVVLGVAAAADEREPLKLSRILLLVPAVLLGGLAVALTGEGFRSAETQMRQLFAGARQASQVTVPAKRKIEKHPADYLLYTYAAAAEVGLKGGDPHNALAYANRALALNPNDPSAHYAAARALVALDGRGQALLEYHLALEVSPDRGALVREAVGYANTIDEVRTLGGNDPQLLADLARATRLKGETTALLMSEAAAMPKAPPELTLEAVGLWVAQGKIDVASEQLDAAFKREGPSPDLYLARSRLEQARHDTEAAAKALDQGLTKWPGQFDLTLERVRMELSEHHHGQAQKLLQQASAVAVQPAQRLELSLVEAQVDIEMGRLNRAIELYQGAVLRFPSTRTHSALASAYVQAGRYDDAISELRAAEHFEGKEGQQALDDYIHTLETQRDARRAAAKQ